MAENGRSTTWDTSQRDPRNFIEQLSYGSLYGYRAATYMYVLNQVMRLGYDLYAVSIAYTA